MIDVIILAGLLVGAGWALTERRNRRAGAGADPSGARLVPAGAARPAQRLRLQLPSVRIAHPLRPAGAGALLGAGLLLAWFGQQWLTEPQSSGTAVALYIAGLALIVGLDRYAQHVTPAGGEMASPGSDPNFLPARVHAGLAPSQRILLAGAIASALFLWVQLRGQHPTDSYGLPVAVWVLSLTSALMASGLSPLPALGRWPFRIPRGWRPERAWLLAAIIAGFAFAVRLVALDRFPYAFGGDEGSQAMSAIGVLEGTLNNPFGTGWYSAPTLFFFVQAGSILFFGDSVEGVRAISGLVGAATVVLTYLLARRLFGWPAALIAATLLAGFHFHVHFSRLASSQIMDPLAVVAALYFLDRGLTERRPADCLLAGMAIGLSQYAYLGSRIIPFVAVAYVVFFVLRGARPTPVARVAASARPLVGWLVLGAFLTYLPLLAYYLAHPVQFNSRVNQVSIFTSGWLEQEQKLTGKSTAELLVDQVRQAVLLPFHTQPGGWYMGDRPFVGAPMAVPLAIGLTLATTAVFRREFFAIATAYWACMLGLALTVSPSQTQRIVLAAPLMAMFAAVAIYRLMLTARQLVRLPGPAVAAAGGAVVALITLWNVYYYFRAPLEFRLYGDHYTMVATELAYYVRSLGPGSTVFFLGPPRMWYYGFQTLPFIARGGKGIDMERRLEPGMARPVLTGPTLFVALPERSQELLQARSWFPGGETREFRAHNGSELFTSYEVRG